MTTLTATSDLDLVEANAFGELFTRLGWSSPDITEPIHVIGGHTVRCVASCRGVRVFVCTDPTTPRARARIAAHLSGYASERVVIFSHADVQHWEHRGRAFTHYAGCSGAAVEKALDALTMPDDPTTRLGDVLTRVGSAFDAQAA